MRKFVTACFTTAALLLVAGCSDPGSPGGGGGNGGTFSAVINGQAWNPAPFTISGRASAGGQFTFSGATAAGVALSLTFYHIGAPGTYPLGVGGTVPGGSAALSIPPAAWWTALSGNSGSVVVSTVTPSRIAGTFSFAAKPLSAGATGEKTVTQGQFDISFDTPGSITIAPNAGSTFGGTMNSQPWNAATIVTVTHPSSGSLTIGASNDTQMVNVTISGFTGPGTYALGTGVARNIQVTIPGSSSIWGGSSAIGVGTVVVSSYTTSRVQGTYTATLPGALGTAGTVTLSGSFSVGLQGG